MFPITIGVVSVLSLRQVSVPADVESLTRIDFILGASVAASVSVLIVAGVLATWGGTLFE
jgi:hypothetical protein